MTIREAADLLAFWTDAGPERWFKSDEAFDATFRDRFLSLYQSAAAGKLDGSWIREAESSLALVILLDQFPRNAFRGTARAFATDAHARKIADLALSAWFDVAVPEELRFFFYMPFQHSESLVDQDRSVALHQKIGKPEWALKHREIIQRFGRFPHRNAVLGRESTEEERKFLAEGGFSG